MVKKILCIDRDTPLVSEYVAGLRKLEPEIKTDFCTTLEDARSHFKDQYYGLIIIDLFILNRDILEFIEDIRRGNFYVDIIFTGSYTDPSTIKKIELLKDIEVLLKPFSIEWFVSRVKKYFLEGISIGNRIDTIGPCFYMRLMNLGSCTAICKVTNDDKSGTIHFEKGEIIHAKSWGNTGELAIIDLIDLNNPNIDITSDEKVGSQKISMDFATLMSIVSSQSKKKCIEKVTESDGEDSGFVEYVIGEVDSVKGMDGYSVVNKVVESMGQRIAAFPEDSEVDLIERVSEEIKDKSNLIKFKKNMMSYLKEREMGKIRKEEN